MFYTFNIIEGGQLSCILNLTVLSDRPWQFVMKFVLLFFSIPKFKVSRK